MTAGYDLADALAILDKWESLTDDQVRALGLLGSGNLPNRLDKLGVLLEFRPKSRDIPH